MTSERPVRPAGPIGYYVHHHGAGHRRRFERLAAASPVPMTALSQLRLDGGVRIASDRVADLRDGDDPTAHGRFHWAPRRPDVMAPFVRDVVDFVLARRPVGLIVDVSVEVAVTARTCGIPVVVVRQHGDRSDPAHRLAYDIAEGFLAPFPAAVEDPDTPASIVDRTVYAGYLGSPPGDARDTGGPRRLPGSDDLVVIIGRGGSARLDTAVRSLSADARYCVHVLGGDRSGAAPDVVRHGWVAEPVDLLRERPVVVAAAGNNAIADAAVAGCPLVLVHEDRPFDEQRRHAQLLDAAGAAIHVPDPASADWPSVIAAARARSSTLASFASTDASRVVREVIAHFAHADVG